MSDLQPSKSQGARVIIGDRLRALREYKALSQVDMEKRTGLFRYYISRVENGHTIPTLETLARFARALEVPVFHLVYEEDDPYQLPILPKSVRSIENFAGLSKNESRLLQHFNLLISQLPERDRELLFGLARRMLNRVTRASQAMKRRKPQRKARPFGANPSDKTHRRQIPNNRKQATNPKQNHA
jgi:transcriptional regulator with XRE-family HTH domain